MRFIRSCGLKLVPAARRFVCANTASKGSTLLVNYTIPDKVSSCIPQFAENETTKDCKKGDERVVALPLPLSIVLSHFSELLCCVCGDCARGAKELGWRVSYLWSTVLA